jgi:small subunit ribosomal protein S2
MPRTNFDELLEAGVHFGHLKRKWNPNMAPYIFMERNGIHIIDLHKTVAKIDEAANAIKQIAKSGRRVLFVATKKQAKDLVAERISKTEMPYVTERWPGGLLTNFSTIRKSVRKMESIDKLRNDKNFDNLSKREKLQINREREKLEKQLGSISDLTRIPHALFVVDVFKEKIAIAEANKLGITTFAIVDTNSNPDGIDFVIPANDDATKSISLIIDIMASAVEEGIEERKMENEKKAADAKAAKVAKAKQKAAEKAEESDEDDDTAEVNETEAKEENK